MNVEQLLSDKQLKPKAKTEELSRMLLSKEVSLKELITVAESSKDSNKATCIEALEFATRAEPKIGTKVCLDFVTKTLLEKAPRVKWESAKVIGNIAHLHPDKLDDAIKNLLVNSEFPGTVVRWSAAYALGEIVKLKTKHNKALIPAIEAIIKREEKNSIQKIYRAALKMAESDF